MKKTEHPFKVPEGYFEQFPDRLMERIRQEEQLRKQEKPHVRRLSARLAVAAAIAGLLLVSYPLFRILAPGSGAGKDPDEALLEQTGLFNYEYEMAAYLERETDSVYEDEAYLDQAMEFLAMNDVEMDLIFE
jgi:hypothetical protein